MEKAANLIEQLKTNQSMQPSSFNWHSYIENKCKVFNEMKGHLEGENCPLCLNRGDIAINIDDEMMIRDCVCKPARKSYYSLKRSGLAQVIGEYTFENFKDKEPWQKQLKLAGFKFLQDHDRKWFFAGGQVGCGKTHICTAITGGFIRSGLEARYMLWRDEVVKLKACVNESGEYKDLIEPLKTAKVLYIDDFFKTEKDKKPTTGDINVAFELINYRYCNPDLITIISSELSVDDILSIDEAVGSRIYQRTKEFNVAIPNDKDKNYRLRRAV